jgi:RNA polymerase sigma-70 factor (ECF subfamily)
MDKPQPTAALQAPARPSSPPAPSSPRASREACLDLARRAASGDVRSTRLLLEIVAPSVVRVVKSAMGTRHPEADDAAQLALIGFVQALPGFRGECDPSYFAVRIAIRTARAARRRFRSRHDQQDDSVNVDDIEAPLDGPRAAQRRRAVRRLVDQLPEEQAETLVLRFMLGWKLHEIAGATGAPFNTVRSRLRLAKEALLRRIEQDPSLADVIDLLDEA